MLKDFGKMFLPPNAFNEEIRKINTLMLEKAIFIEVDSPSQKEENTSIIEVDLTSL
jgi:hypothetical protein